jgi:hypothetical protein
LIEKIKIYSFEKSSGKDRGFLLNKNLHFYEQQNKQLLMENDILKQAALIMGRK